MLEELLSTPATGRSSSRNSPRWARSSGGTCRKRSAQEVLFLHGGTSPQAARNDMVERFQDGRTGRRSFVLSLKAGGTGLNLTAANHVFHFDRWWNPAVENQATDRAFRIGQTRNVQVHKFVCAGTVEERIDEMIDRKNGVAAKVVGTGEALVDGTDRRAIAEVLALRPDAMEGED